LVVARRELMAARRIGAPFCVVGNWERPVGQGISDRRLGRRRYRRKRICNRRRGRIPNGRSLSSCAECVYAGAFRGSAPEPGRR
jgi:hypothetical protein